MARFYLYADESGKDETADYTSVCGFICHESEWARIDQMWENLRFGLSLPPIHMRFVMSPDRDASGAWVKIRERYGASWEDCLLYTSDAF